MSAKRPHDAVDADKSSTQPDAKKRKGGFRVGPENLPDGAWRRRNTKIKEQLIHKAKVKKAYRKVKAEVLGASGADEPSQIHPDRLQRIDDSESAPARESGASQQQQPPKNSRGRRQARHLVTGANGEAPDSEEVREQRRQERELREQEAEKKRADEDAARAAGKSSEGNKDRRKHRRPDYYEKALEEGSQKKAEAEARAAEQKRREEERQRKQAEREKIRRAMLKARGVKPGGDRAGRQHQYQNQHGPRKLGRESHVLLEKVKRLVG